MDNSNLAGGFLSGTSSGFLDLESSTQRHQLTQLGHRSHPHNQHMKSSLNMIPGLENDHPFDSSSKCLPVNFGKGKGIASVCIGNLNNTSEEDEPSYTEDGNGENLCGSKDKRGTPWQRMKWTDNIVRLLIAVVACVGDDGTFDGVELNRKSGVLPKKGKWKTVSKIMISKGCHVSPQQCEDKFNDLNKRYKKLNEILGKGTSCRVVENPSLMDSMPQLSAKVKEDVRKILNSKHLFYSEMCAYHNGQRTLNFNDLNLQVNSVPTMLYSKEANDSEEEEEEEEAEANDDSEDEESEDVDNKNIGGDSERTGKYNEKRKRNEEGGSFWPQPSILVGFEAEIAEYSQGATKSQGEQKQFFKKQMLHLQEQRVRIQAEAFELEERRFKWLRFCSKKETELERLRLENERMMLENEGMVLQLKQKEMEIDLKRSGASLETSSRQY